MDRLFRTQPTFRKSRPERGFTLVELAIVLAVAGLMLVGLWRLLSSGNQQVRDQNAASQQQQLLSAVKGYLASAEGTNFVTQIAASSNASLPMPSSAANASGNAGCTTDANMTGASPAAVPGFCSFLPAGFWTGEVNSYGQSFVIRVLKDAAVSGTPPNTYSFMIVTSGGDTIPDTSGGRISAFIGNDGGFIYANNICSTPVTQMACGSYGTWSLNTNTAYGFSATASGHIASRTYVMPTADNTLPWLARPLLTGDSIVTPVWNTMETSLLLGGGTNNLYMGGSTTATTGGSTLFMQDGVINLQGGSVTGNGTSYLSIVNSAQATNSQILVGSGCTQSSPGTPTTCPYSVVVTGDESVSNILLANTFYAQTFIYQNSDIRVKTNIHPISNALRDIMKLNPVSFTLKTNNKDSFGVIAQELEKIYPQLVTEGPGVKAVNYDGLIGPLISAVQELKHENDELRDKLDAQEKRQDRLEQKLRSSKSDAP